jgi:hypothetical protein
MKRSLVRLLAGWFCLAVFAGAAAAGEPKGPSSPKSPAASDSKSAAKHTLRYRFQPGETVRWKVSQEAQVETTVSGTTQIAEANTLSVSAWQLKKVEPDGTATFEYLLESVDMRQKVSGRMEMRYNSQTDKKAPAVFEAVAKTIGVPLTRVTLDAKGKVLKLEPLVGRPGGDSQSQVVIPLPDNPVAVGQSWSSPSDVEVSVQGTVTKIKTLETYTLQDVQDGVATIRAATQIVTPMHDPVLEAQVVQRESTGTIRFDLKAGRILSRKVEVDKRVVGFAGHGASVLGYRMQLTAELLAKTGDVPGKEEPPSSRTQSAERPAAAKVK